MADWTILSNLVYISIFLRFLLLISKLQIKMFILFSQNLKPSKSLPRP